MCRLIWTDTYGSCLNEERIFHTIAFMGDVQSFFLIEEVY